MPVKLEILRQLNDDDRRDIGKILAETTQPSDPFSDLDQLQSSLNEQQWLFAGRFNDRIVGIIIASRNATNASQTNLEFAGVRQLTQRRGVIHQLLIHVERWANNEQQQLIIDQISSDFTLALIKRGFVNEGKQWIHRPNN